MRNHSVVAYEYTCQVLMNTSLTHRRKEKHEQDERKRSKHTHTHCCPSGSWLLGTKGLAGTGEDVCGCDLSPCADTRYLKSSFSAWEANRQKKTERQPAAFPFLPNTPPPHVG